MNEELRLPLSARRPSGLDDDDPAIAEALAKISTDPQLASWAEAEQRSDASIATKLRELQPPPGLRDTILAGARVGRRRWWQWFNEKAWRNFRNSELVAVAALVMILATALLFKYTGGPTPASWQEAAAKEVARIESSEVGLLNVAASSMPEVHQWINEQTCPDPNSLPDEVKGLGIVGCTKMSWKGTPMSIVCFNLKDGCEVHLVTISRRQLLDPPPEKHPKYETLNGYTTASWSDGDSSMMLIGKIEESEMRKLMGEKPTAANFDEPMLALSLAAR